MFIQFCFIFNSSMIYNLISLKDLSRVLCCMCCLLILLKNKFMQVAPIEGMALLHIHGYKCMLHEARNVTKGIKYVFRSDVVFA